MIQIPVWVIWAMIATPFVAGTAVAIFFNKFVTKDTFHAFQRDQTISFQKQIDDLHENRKEVWEKIDEIKDDTTEIKIRVAKLSP